MKKVVKVNIGNLAFTLEDDAYNLIYQYLEDLKQYYKGAVNGDEIVESIEERMAELLSEKIANESVVSFRIAQEVIDTLGKPEGFEGEDRRESKTEEQATRKIRKFFRDKDNAVLGGVCSGLSKYLNISPVLLRVVFVLGVLIPFGGSFFVLAYFILWIIFPAAKTVEQKYAMRGKTPTVSDIEKNIEEIGKTIEQKAKEFGAETQGFWVQLGNIIGRCIGLIFILIGMVGLFVLSILFLEFQTNIFHNDLKELYFIFSYLPPKLFVVMKIALALAISIPIIGFLYSGIKLLFNFKTPNLKVGAVLSIVWILSLMCITVLTITSTRPYWNSSKVVNNDFLSEKKDTLYVKYVDSEKWQNGVAYIEGNTKKYSLWYSGYFNDNYKFIAYPTVKLDREPYQNAFYLESRSTLYPYALSLREINKIQKTEFYRFEGDTLFLYPIIYTKKDKVKEVSQKITLHVENNTTVIVTEPVRHQFESKFKYNNVEDMIPRCSFRD